MYFSSCGQSVKENKFDQYSAMYHLLLEKIKLHQRMALTPQNLPVSSQPQRKASITTGVGELLGFGLHIY